MQEQRSRTAIRSWYRAQRVAPRRDRNVGATSSQCTQLRFVQFLQDIQVHLCAMHAGGFCVIRAMHHPGAFCAIHSGAFCDVM